MESLRRKFKNEPLRDSVDDVRERECDEIVRPPERHEAGLRYPIGDGKGVMSAIAASAGEDTVDDRIDEGESDSVLDMVFILIG